jgi:hypothetical protein
MFEEETFAIADITYGAPVVDSIAVATEYAFVANDLVSTPVVDTTDTLFQQLLTPDKITAGTPVVDSGTLTFFYDFDATEITLGAPSVDSIALTQFFNFNADDITATPVVDTLPFFQTHILAGDEITAGVPTLPVRFLWDYQETVPKTWTKVSDITDVWTVVQDAA